MHVVSLIHSITDAYDQVLQKQNWKMNVISSDIYATIAMLNVGVSTKVGYNLTYDKNGHAWFPP
jgi:hypothetical protein